MGASSAHALSIVPVYDASITSRPNAAAIEAAFQAVADRFDKALSSAAVLKVAVGWGEVDGKAIGSGQAASSIEFLRSGYSYSDVTSYLEQAAAANPNDTVLASIVANLPANDPTRLDNFSFTYGQAQALGLLPASMSLNTGYVGFSSTLNWDLNGGTVPAGQYDFQGLAAHELGEVMGRISGLRSATPSYATTLDLLRYSAPGVSSFSYSNAAYFSVDGGATNLGAFNTQSAGDRGDWSSTLVPRDPLDAYLAPGVSYSLSANDWTELDALGWGYTGSMAFQSYSGPSDQWALNQGAVPEPKAWTAMLLGFGLAGFMARRRSSPLAPGS